MTRPKLVLIDGHAIIHRAFHAVSDLSTRAGEPVNATFGFASMLMKALLEERPEYIAVTFDRPTPTFRHEQYALYKAQRPTLPDNMRPQFARIHELVEAFGIKIYEHDGYEADDILGTLSVQANQQGLNTVIYTGDMDTLQLVNDHVLVKVAKRGITEVTEYNQAEVEARYGLPPQKLPDFKGLVGDKSDNIPGVPGIGEKTAARLIAEYGDIEGVVAHADKLKPKEQRLLLDNAEQARQSRFLATIVLDAPVLLDIKSCRLAHVNKDRVLALFRQLEFRSLVERVLSLFRQLGITTTSEEEHSVEETRNTDAAVASLTDLDRSDLLYKPPIGVVSVTAPPPPPGYQGEIIVSSETTGAPAITTAAPAQSESALIDQPVQMNLFAVDEHHAETVHRLRLPRPAAINVPFLPEDGERAKHTNTLVVDSEEALRVLIKSLSDAGAFAFDTETTSQEPRHAQLVGLSFSMAPGEAYYVPIGHVTTPDGQEPGKQLPLEYVLTQLRPLLEDSHILKYMHNAKYDMAVL
ncbi:MAG TPA: 5'-3' exonuclease H3TH domain-containing protein, partial [Ktedonobacteraceae bacterium]